MPNIVRVAQRTRTTTLEYTDAEVRDLITADARGRIDTAKNCDVKISDCGARYQGCSLAATVRITEEDVS